MSNTPHPFEPPWILKIGPLVQSGKGLLPPEFHARRGAIEEFVLPCGGFTLSIFPVLGIIRMDSEPQFVGAPAVRYKLYWFRRMSMQLSTHDNNTAAPDCLWYGAGLTLNDEPVCYYKVFADRHVELAE